MKDKPINENKHKSFKSFISARNNNQHDLLENFKALETHDNECEKSNFQRDSKTYGRKPSKQVYGLCTCKNILMPSLMVIDKDKNRNSNHLKQKTTANRFHNKNLLQMLQEDPPKNPQNIGKSESISNLLEGQGSKLMINSSKMTLVNDSKHKNYTSTIFAKDLMDMFDCQSYETKNISVRSSLLKKKISHQNQQLSKFSKFERAFSPFNIEDSISPKNLNKFETNDQQNMNINQPKNLKSYYKIMPSDHEDGEQDAD